MSFALLSPADPLWGEAFCRLPPERQDVFYTPEFAQLCQETLNREDRVACAALVAGDAVALHPFAVRDLGRVTGRPELAGMKDTLSLYGRGGLVCSAAALPLLARFRGELKAAFREMGVLCSLDRLHPVMANESLAGPDTECRPTGDFFVADLTPPFEEIEAGFRPSVRKDAKKALRNGVSCFVDADGRHLADFLDIYQATMDRNAAGRFYYFGRDYFARLAERLPGRHEFHYAAVDGHIVSCELVLFHGHYAHSFLGGTRRDALPLAANPLLKVEIMRRCQALGCHHYLLGGGQHPGDGIHAYKKAFAPEGARPSLIGCTVHDACAWAALKARFLEQGWPMREGRFQFYDPD